MARILDGMSGREMFTSLPVLSVAGVSLMTPSFSRSCRYTQYLVCFLAGTPYSSQTTAYVFSAADDGTVGLLLIALATARRTIFLLTSRDLSLVSDTEL